MKALFFFFTILTVGLSCSAQSKGTIKLYGYSQVVSGGKAPEPNDKGLRVSRGTAKNYFLYAESPGRIYPSELWVDGTRYGVTIKTINETPVEYGDEANIGSPKKVLVPKTSQNVVQLIPIAATESKAPSAKAKSLARSAALVVVYKKGSKFYYQTLSRLSSLAPGNRL
ncbi:hypothetical protein [Flavisolibacter nicotianae]|uniref:hypothetical protein n=1 Tax=Flavisolibacter nicotianae TaxID=2364882 RepID=UPI000EB1C616|nr:hypothetical protein [Flavisolibacter nicotianae]